MAAATATFNDSGLFSLVEKLGMCNLWLISRLIGSEMPFPSFPSTIIPFEVKDSL